MSSSEAPHLQTIGLDDAAEPLVVAVDIGSGSTRCGLYDAHARPIERRTFTAEHSFTETADGAVEIDADQVVAEVSTVLSDSVRGLPPGSVKGVAMDTFASSLVCVNTAGDALTPCLTYADSRSAPQLAKLRELVDEARSQQRTGTRLHTSYHPPRLLWLREEHPDIFAATKRFVSLGEYVYAKLAGTEAAATSTMAWAGILDRHSMELDDELLAAVGVDRSRFAPVVDPDRSITDVRCDVAQRWPALAGAAWLPAVPDGYASNLGVGADEPSTAALSAGTSGAIRVIVDGAPEELPPGLWAYRVSSSQSIVGGALNDVGRVVDWLENTLAPVDRESLRLALSGPARPGIPLVLPFLTGERSTGWAGDARAVLTGVSSSTTPLEVWRGAAEGVAVSYGRVFEQLRRANPRLERLVASGGVASSYPGLMDVVAQGIGFPVQMVDVHHVTMRGAAMLALAVSTDAPAAELPRSEAVVPRPAERQYFDDLAARFAGVYDALIADGRARV
ncbi:MAG: gluconokinase [Gordonia sp. (in: high G+C Gram-positive bacteria)]